MKKNSLTKILILIAVAAAMLMLLCACAKSAGMANDMATTESSTMTGGYVVSDDMKFDMVLQEEAAEVAPGSAALETGAAGGGNTEGGTASTMYEKIIYSANAYVETTEFDAAIEEVYFMVDSYGGFIEGSYISGANYSAVYYGRQTYRNAWFTIRIPAASFADVSGSLDRFGYVTGIETYSDNITTQFYDTQTRRDAYMAEHERLIELLDKAENVDELIYIEQRLSEVQYSIDSLNSTLKNWQNEVDYSTLHLYIDEVAVIRVTPQVTETYWQRMATGLKDTLTGIGEFFKELFMGFVVSLPVLILLAIGIAALVIIIKAVAKKRKKKFQDSRYYAKNEINRDDIDGPLNK